MSIQSSIDSALAYVAGTSPVRTAYKRITTTSGGDSLLGLGATTTDQDTKLNPQPAFSQLGDRASVLSSTDLVLGATDYSFTVSSSALSVEELEQPTLSIVLKGPDAVVEEFSIIGYKPSMLQGAYITFTLYARSKSRK